MNQKIIKTLTYNASLEKIEEDVMAFLSEVQLNFPDAISMASGRPDESFFDLENTQKYIDTFVNYRAKQNQVEVSEYLGSLGQYNRAKGIVNDLAVEYLKKDYNIQCIPDDLIITVGSQEGMMLSLLTLMNQEVDTICIEDPTYIGISYFSLINNYNIKSIPVKEDGICLETLEEVVRKKSILGKPVKLVYVIPDFQNPTGGRMPIENRKKLIRLAVEYNFIIIEDNAYGDFTFDKQQYPTLKSLDSHGVVVYLHSFSKILHPSLRIGIMVANRKMNEKQKLSHLIAKVKGYTTVNTPALPQAVLGGILLDQKFSLKAYNEKKLANLKSKRDKVLEMLDVNFKKSSSETLHKIRWNTPEGGYFLTLTLPFSIGKEDVVECASTYKVIFTPMSFFYLGNGGENQIRIAYSYMQTHQIEKAIKNLAAFLATK